MYFKDTASLHLDHECPYNNYVEWFRQLDIANNMVTLLESGYLDSAAEEDTVRTKLYNTIANYSSKWWD